MLFGYHERTTRMRAADVLKRGRKRSARGLWGARAVPRPKRAFGGKEELINVWLGITLQRVGESMPTSGQVHISEETVRACVFDFSITDAP